MKIQSKEILLDAIDADLAWRKKELSYLLSNVNPKSPNYKTHLRSGIVMLYSHWEGFVKNVCEYYLSYIKHLKLNYNELHDCFIAVSLKYRLSLFQSTNKATIHTQIVSFLLNELNQRASVPDENIVRTGSNLNSDILKEMLTMIGIDYTDYELKANLIDSVLLKNRNSIAHGQFIELDDVEYQSLHSDILNIMDDIRTKVSNAAVLESYKR
jgi:hypothetical protein